jgi:hypothetical protein
MRNVMAGTAQGINQMTADKDIMAGDKNFHDKLFSVDNIRFGYAQRTERGTWRA